LFWKASPPLILSKTKFEGIRNDKDTARLVSLPPMFQTCPFLIMAITPWPASVRRAVQKPPKSSPGRKSTIRPRLCRMPHDPQTCGNPANLKLRRWRNDPNRFAGTERPSTDGNERSGSCTNKLARAPNSVASCVGCW
jgi:hypothetical protein